MKAVGGTQDAHLQSWSRGKNVVKLFRVKMTYRKFYSSSNVRHHFIISNTVIKFNVPGHVLVNNSLLC